MTPRQQTYTELVTAIKLFLYTLHLGDAFQPERADLEFAGLLHDVLAKVPVEWEGLGEP